MPVLRVYLVNSWCFDNVDLMCDKCGMDTGIILCPVVHQMSWVIEWLSGSVSMQFFSMG